MIAFDCPSCGKHYTFSNKFIGRKLTCTGCKSENIVPEPEEELGLVPLSGKEEIHSAPPSGIRPAPLPPPLPMGMIGVTGVPGIPEVVQPTGSPDTASDLSDADSTILAFVFEEKQKARAAPPTPPPLPKTAPAAEEPKPRSNVVFWSILLSTLTLSVGLGVYLGVVVDWRDPDPRISQAKELEDQKIRTWTQMIAKESEAKSLPHRAAESWRETNKLLNDIVLVVDEIDDQRYYLREAYDEEKTGIQEKLTIAETQLAELRKRVNEFSTHAANSEVESVAAANDARLLKLESEFYALQEQAIHHDIATRPDLRIPAEPVLFDTESNRIPLDESFSLTSDWTENFFRRFCFPESSPDRFFAAFDCSRRTSGEKSLRVTSLTRQWITLRFPERDAQADLSGAKFFRFSLQFPNVTDPLSTSPNAGKISIMSVRFGNAAGVVEFQTISPRYCEALFFDGRSRFTPIEFPLTGNRIWRRRDDVDQTRLEHLGGGTQASFFARIDWVELRFLPLSDRTTFWIDAVSAAEKKTYPDYDLDHAEKSQREQRKKEEEFWKNRRK